MKNNIYKESSISSRNKKYVLKSKLTSLADNAKSRINNNQKLRELIKVKKKQILLYKEKFINYTNYKITTKNKLELLNRFKKELKADNSDLILENNLLTNIIKARHSKNEEILGKKDEILYEVLENLESTKKKNFLYKNALILKNNNIKAISDILYNIKIHLNDDIIDSVEFDESELEESMIKSEFKKILEFYTFLNDQNLAKFNKYQNKTKKLSEKISELKLIKKNIKKYIKTLNNLISYYDFSTLPENGNIIIEGEEIIGGSNEIDEINNISNNQLFFSEESESFITDNDINISNTNDFIIIRNIYNEEKSKIKLEAKLPLLDLTLINFNKQKLTYDYKEKSLSRNDNNDHDILSLRIIKLKEEIKSLSDKNDKLKEKIKKYADKINQLNNIIININSQNKNILRIKSVKKRKFLFNSENALSNISRNSKSISYRADITRSHNQYKLMNYDK